MISEFTANSLRKCRIVEIKLQILWSTQYIWPRICGDISPRKIWNVSSFFATKYFASCKPQDQNISNWACSETCYKRIKRSLNGNAPLKENRNFLPVFKAIFIKKNLTSSAMFSFHWFESLNSELKKRAQNYWNWVKSKYFTFKGVLLLLILNLSARKVA